MYEYLNNKEFRFAPLCLEDLLPLIVRQLGYPSSQVVKEEIGTQIHQAAEYGLQQIKPLSFYKLTPLLSQKRGMLSGQDFTIHSNRWANLIGRLVAPEVLCGFIVSVGQDFDKALRKVQEKSVFQAYILDAVGSVIAEQLAEQMEQYLAGLLTLREYQSTARFSPGYCDWPLKSGQLALFRFLKPEKIGVEITSAAMMSPRKTISAVMVGAKEVPWKTPCCFCKKKDCQYRRDEQVPSGNNLEPQKSS